MYNLILRTWVWHNNMACCFASAEERAATRRSKEIDRYLAKERKRGPTSAKILLLGAHGSGKSTFLKQMRLFYGRGYTEEDRLQLRPVVYGAILRGMEELIRCQKQFQIPFQHSENVQNCQMFKEWCATADHFCGVTDVEFSPIVKRLMTLWRDEGIQETVKRANNYNLVGNVFYFNYQKTGKACGQCGDAQYLFLKSNIVKPGNESSLLSWLGNSYCDFSACNSHLAKV